MKLKRLDNSGAVLPLSDEHRREFETSGLMHIKQYFSESLVERLRQELVEYRDSQFRFAGLSRYIDSRNIFELDACVSQIGSDLLNANNVFLFDGAVGGRPACCIWIPLQDQPVSTALFQNDHLGQVHVGDCVIFRSLDIAKKITSGLVLQVVGDSAAKEDDTTVLEETEAAV